VPIVIHPAYLTVIHTENDRIMYMSKVRRIHVTRITYMRIRYYCFFILYQQIRVTCIRLSLDIYMIRSFCHKIEGTCLLYCRLYSDSLRLLSMKSHSDCSNFAFHFSRYHLLYSAFFCFLISSIIFRLLLLSYIVNIVVVCHNRITRRKCDTQVKHTHTHTRTFIVPLSEHN
jgi:hypothetical protein